MHVLAVFVVVLSPMSYIVGAAVVGAAVVGAAVVGAAVTCAAVLRSCRPAEH